MPANSESNDHRPRVAAERRERMRRRLIESAMIVFAEKGVGASVIPDVVAAAEVSQGSFYNYFRTNEDLLAAVSNELSSDMIALIEGVVGEVADPPLRVAMGIRSYLHLTRSQRLLACFLAGAGLRLAGAGKEARQQSSVYHFLPADLEEGQKRGDFIDAPVDTLIDIIKGASLIAIDRMAHSRVAKNYPDTIVAGILRSLGMSADAAAHLTAQPLPRLAPAADSLLARVVLRAAAGAQANA